MMLAGSFCGLEDGSGQSGLSQQASGWDGKKTEEGFVGLPIPWYTLIQGWVWERSRG